MSAHAIDRSGKIGEKKVIDMLGTQARELLVRAFEQIRNANIVAKIFGVSRRTVYRYEEAKQAGESLDVKTSQRGRKAVLDSATKAAIVEAVKAQPDISIREIKEKLGLTAGDETVRQCLVKAGYRRKKKSIHATERERPRCGGETGRMAGETAKNAGGSSRIPG